MEIKTQAQQVQAGDEDVEITVVIGRSYALQGRGRVVQASATGDRRPEALGVGASTVGRGGRKAGSRHENLTVRVIEALMDKNFRRGEIEAALSGRCACPKRTLSDITRRIRERRTNAAIVAQAVRVAQERLRLGLRLSGGRWKRLQRRARRTGISECRTSCEGQALLVR